MRWKNFLLDCEYCGHLSSHISNACSRLFSFFSFITTWCPDIKTCLITFMMFYNIAQTICQLDFSVACALNALMYFFFKSPPQTCSSVLSVCAFLPVNSQDASHPGPGTHPHHQQVSGLHSGLAGKPMF